MGQTNNLNKEENKERLDNFPKETERAAQSHIVQSPTEINRDKIQRMEVGLSHLCIIQQNYNMDLLKDR
jgi:hypothetical protein